MEPRQTTPGGPQPLPRPQPSQANGPYISDFTAQPGRSDAGRTPAPASQPPLGATQTVTGQGSHYQTPPFMPGMKAQATPSVPATPSAADSHHTSFAPPAAPDIEPKEKPAPPRSGMRDMLSIFGVLASALLLAFLLISFVFQSYQVDGPSMETTLQNNDHLIVWKVPKTIANLTSQHYMPNRGDVIIFNEPGIDGTSGNKQLIKRVMALPGERITVKDGVVTVYSKDKPDGFQPDKSLPYGNVITTTPGNVDVTLRDGEVFVCGDNRTNSLDSRIFGPVTSQQIVGKLVVRVLPLNTVKLF